MSPATLIDLLQQCVRAVPDRLAVRSAAGSLTYAELAHDAFGLAAFLAARGVQPGERVALLVEKTPEALVGFLGANAAGGVMLPVDYNLSPSAMQALFDLFPPAALVVAPRFVSLLDQLRLPCPPSRIVVAGASAGTAYTSWGEAVRTPHAGGPQVAVRPDDVAYLNLTSGTTGAPKAALCTHANIWWNTDASVEALGLQPDDVHLIMFPVFLHPHELLARPLFLGGTTVLVEGISPKAIERALAEHRPTCMMAVASIYAGLVRGARGHACPLRLAESGGMPVDPQLAAEFCQRMGLGITPVWGSTETTGIAFSCSPGADVVAGRVGRPCPHYEVRLVGDDGSEPSPGEPGLLAVRGLGVAPGYAGDPAMTARVYRDGWLHTDDLLRVDADGVYHFAGRASRMLKVSGLKVHPLEIEQVLALHPAVREAAVVGMRDATRGEVPRAVVVPRSGCAPDAEELRAYCRTRLPPHKVPRAVEVVVELPKNQAGKVQYQRL